MTDETMDNEQHEHGSQPAIAAGRGAIVVGLAVLLGIVLLQIYDRNGGVSKALNGGATVEFEFVGADGKQQFGSFEFIVAN